jgi:hypothetical protein
MDKLNKSAEKKKAGMRAGFHSHGFDFATPLIKKHIMALMIDLVRS